MDIETKLTTKKLTTSKNIAEFLTDDENNIGEDDDQTTENSMQEIISGYDTMNNNVFCEQFLRFQIRIEGAAFVSENVSMGEIDFLTRYVSKLKILSTLYSDIIKYY